MALHINNSDSKEEELKQKVFDKYIGILTRALMIPHSKNTLSKAKNDFNMEILELYSTVVNSGMKIPVYLEDINEIRRIVINTITMGDFTSRAILYTVATKGVNISEYIKQSNIKNAEKWLREKGVNIDQLQIEIADNLDTINDLYQLGIRDIDILMDIISKSGGENIDSYIEIYKKRIDKATEKLNKKTEEIRSNTKSYSSSSCGSSESIFSSPWFWLTLAGAAAVGYYAKDNIIGCFDSCDKDVVILE